MKNFYAGTGMADLREQTVADSFYLQDTRGYVGNDVLFWAKGGGYTTDVSKAEIFTRDDAFHQHTCRNTDRPWPKRYIDGKTRPAVDHQYIKYKEAMDEVSLTQHGRTVHRLGKQ
jgi:hypothetical protein